MVQQVQASCGQALLPSVNTVTENSIVKNESLVTLRHYELSHFLAQIGNNHVLLFKVISIDIFLYFNENYS